MGSFGLGPAVVDIELVLVTDCVRCLVLELNWNSYLLFLSKKGDLRFLYNLQFTRLKISPKVLKKVCQNNRLSRSKMTLSYFVRN